ncbi:MAG: FMN-binding protein [Nitrospinota bacterium]|nr:FMN-binding protein [Nitrospinota bacterium]
MNINNWMKPGGIWPRVSFFIRAATLTGILISLLTFSVGAEEEEEYVEQMFLTKQEALKVAFPGVKKVKKKKVWLTDGQTAAIKKILGDQIKYNERRVTHYFGLDEENKPVGAMVIGNEIGRSYPITFMVVLNTDGTVKDVEIMVYREPHGWEVRFESFMSQFFGRGADDPFNNINNITGATLSVRSMTKGVKKAVAEFQVIYKDKVK